MRVRTYQDGHFCFQRNDGAQAALVIEVSHGMVADGAERDERLAALGDAGEELVGDWLPLGYGRASPLDYGLDLLLHRLRLRGKVVERAERKLIAGCVLEEKGGALGHVLRILKAVVAGKFGGELRLDHGRHRVKHHHNERYLSSLSMKEGSPVHQR